jgi:hypothetical protein
VIAIDAERIAAEAGGEVVREGPGGQPEKAAIDSRAVDPGDLF